MDAAVTAFTYVIGIFAGIFVGLTAGAAALWLLGLAFGLIRSGQAQKDVDEAVKRYKAATKNVEGQ